MEEKKMFGAIAVVAVILVAAFCGVTLMKDDKDAYEAKVTGNVPVFGNANNDDYIDSHDIDQLNAIIDDGSWDKTAYPYADANQDGKIDSADVDIVNKIISGQNCNLYYVDIYDDVVKVSYPVSHSRVGVSYWQQAELATLMGIWDTYSGVPL